MTDELATILDAVIGRLQCLAAEDPAFRAEVRRLAQAVLTATEPAAPEPTAPVAELPAEGLPAAAVLPQLSLGLARAEPEELTLRPERKVHPGVSNEDLPLIEARCRMKAVGARWAGERLRRLKEGADYPTEIEPKDREIIDEAKKLDGCFLWMNHSSGPSPSDLSVWEDVAGCFETLAAGLALVREILEDLEGKREYFEQALDLLAEAHSALRVIIESLDANMDNDQKAVHTWLRATTREQQVFIQRYMRADDPADPAKWSNVGERIEQLDLQLQQSRQRGKQQQARLNKVRYHLKSIRSGRPSDHDWRTLVDTIEAMITDGMPPSNRDIREMLLPVVDDLPEMELPPGFCRVLEELDRYLATRPPAAAEVVQEPTAEVKAASRLLHGRTLVLIGGDRRPYAQDSLKNSLGLKELVWIDTRAHQSIDGFEPYVANGAVAAVLLAIRWSSHSFGEVKDFCDKHGKPLVRLPAGYSPNQVAFQVLQQCGGRLAEGTTAGAT